MPTTKGLLLRIPTEHLISQLSKPSNNSYLSRIHPWESWSEFNLALASSLDASSTQDISTRPFLPITRPMMCQTTESINDYQFEICVGIFAILSVLATIAGMHHEDSLGCICFRRWVLRSHFKSYTSFRYFIQSHVLVPSASKIEPLLPMFEDRGDRINSTGRRAPPPYQSLKRRGSPAARTRLALNDCLNGYGLQPVSAIDESNTGLPTWPISVYCKA